MRVEFARRRVPLVDCRPVLVCPRECLDALPARIAVLVDGHGE